MIKRVFAGLVMSLIGVLSAMAQDTPMSAREFRDFAEGHTLHFRDRAGNYFGSEQYLPSDQTIWLPNGGQCLKGIWAEDAGRICFGYRTGTSCWRLYAEGEDSLYARNADEDGGQLVELWLLRKDEQPLLCPDGPGV